MYQFIRFARASSQVSDFNNGNKTLTAKLLKQWYCYFKLRKTVSKFYHCHFELISKKKNNVGLKTFLRESLFKPEFYVDTA